MASTAFFQKLHIFSAPPRAASQRKYSGMFNRGSLDIAVLILRHTLDQFLMPWRQQEKIKVKEITDPSFWSHWEEIKFSWTLKELLDRMLDVILPSTFHLFHHQLLQ